MSDKRKRESKRTEPAPSMTRLVAGPGPTIERAGKTWRLGYNTQNAKARFEMLVKSHVRSRSRAEDSPEEYQETRDRIYAGHYDTFTKGWMTILNSPEGGILYFLSLLQHHHPDATRDDALMLALTEPDQVADALEEISPDFFKAVAIDWATEKKADQKDAVAMGEEVAKRIAENFKREPKYPPTSMPEKTAEPASVTG